MALLLKQNQAQAKRIQQLEDELREAKKLHKENAESQSEAATKEIAELCKTNAEEVAALKGKIDKITQASVELQQANDQLFCKKEALEKQTKENTENIDSLTTQLDEK